MPAVAERYQPIQDKSFRNDFVNSRSLRPVEAESFLPPLALEVKKIRRDPGKEVLFLLPKTGFQVEGQANLLLENLKFGVPLEKSFQQIEQDIQAFKTEYLVEGPVFPIVLEKVKREGKTRVAGKLYGDKLWLDATDSRERDGTVKKSVAKMEEILTHASPGTTVAMASPDGWSGYDGIKYPDSQFYAITVLPDGKLRGFTLKSHMTLSQNEALLAKYGALDPQTTKDTDPKNRIKRVVGSVVEFSPKDKKSIENIAQDIRHIMNQEVAYVDSSKKERTFSEMMQNLKNPEPLWTLDETTKRLVDGLKEYVSYRVKNPDRQMKRDIEVAMGYTVLQLMHAVRPAEMKNDMKFGVPNSVDREIQPVFNPKKTLEEMQKIAGCAGGGAGDGTVNSITPRNAVFSTEGKLGDNCSCGANLDNHYHCPGCDKKYADETNKSAENRTKACKCGFEFGC